MAATQHELDLVVTDDHRIQFEVGRIKLNEATDILAADGRPTREATELAAAQLAIAIAVSSDDTPIVPSLAERIEALHASKNPNSLPSGSNFFTVDELLSVRERPFLGAARTVVGLIYQAARYSS